MRSILRGVCLAACIAALPALAADEAESARQLYAEGKAEYDLGHIAQALAKFEGAYRVRPVPALLFNIAQCHRLLGDLKSAAMTYRAFLRNENASSAQSQKASELLKQVEEAMERQSSAQKAQPLGLTQPEEHRPAPPPAVVAVATQPKPPAPSIAVETKTAPAAEPGPRVWTWAAGGAAVLAAAGGTLFAMKANSAASDLQSGPHDRAFIDATEPQVRSDASKATILLATAGALAAATAALWVMHF